MSSILKVQTIKAPNDTTAMNISSSGIVTQPEVPAWRLGLTTGQTETTVGGVGQLVNWTNTTSDNCFIQGDLQYSSGIITVQTAGVYMIHANVRIDNIGSGYVITRILINDNSTDNAETYSIVGTPSTNYHNINATDCYKLVANDTIRIRVAASADTNWDIAQQSTFSGHLVG